ncbi:lipoyl(octanoyl) transferase LipB [Coxiella endosymbiont of Amblyomma sculptum]|uniref:lipoyl(octanoyl) transferase LipB n=1 Tax=Coxiella endosymbiont of Amblyomma sculptum TaxID=2487929 RepID=UPI00132F29F7|nr:lipoyl(octanoyl) transferase LipB [Coxiella endosymbiont of Amblyomma sculptum]QHG92716.1 lipoyl(octanoyl) transferase LipB [Coxiella endosymbiont of Amblyomma sculptum]
MIHCRVLKFFIKLFTEYNTDVDVIIRQFDQTTSYLTVWRAMREFTSQRDPTTPDEVWMLEHFPVFTNGLSGKLGRAEKIQEIALVRCDRGGQITYHGPGQLIVYLLLDLKRLGLKTRPFVRTIEQTVIDSLKQLGINNAQGDTTAPGVYIEKAKICSIGLRVRNGWSYHGLACNVSMDLTPFTYINPCGIEGLVVTQICNYLKNVSVSMVRRTMTTSLLENFGYRKPVIKGETTLEFFTNVTV